MPYNTMIECGLCGSLFTRGEAEACQKGCPISKGCGMVTCPACGYEFPPESKIVNSILKLFRNRREANVHHLTKP